MGSFAKLTPIVNNGQLIEIKVLNGGIGYEEGKSSIKVEAAGENAVTDVDIKRWNINVFERDYNNIS